MSKTRNEYSRQRPAQRSLVIAVLILGASVVAPATASYRAIDTLQSTVTVRVFKTGLLRGLADNHEIQGIVKSGFIKDTMPIEARIVVAAGNLRVLDRGASAKDREQVQVRMLGPEVLDANRFPEIRFESSSAEQAQSGSWIVHGQLTLHG